MVKKILEEIKSGETIPFLGNGIFKGTKNSAGATIPFDNESMILGINNNRAMAPKYMDDYSKAAMNIEERRGRKILEDIVFHLFSSEFKRPIIYDIIEEIKPNFVVDLNYDDSLQKIYQKQEHFLVSGVARILAELDRYVSYEYKNSQYVEVENSETNFEKPFLYKPLGTIDPVKNYIVSDADFVDWITEAMGGFSFPNVLKEERKNKKFLFLGTDFGIDTGRMVANEISLENIGGYYVTEKTEFTKREKKFVDKLSLEVLDMDVVEFMKDLKKAL